MGRIAAGGGPIDAGRLSRGVGCLVGVAASERERGDSENDREPERVPISSATTSLAAGQQTLRVETRRLRSLRSPVARKASLFRRNGTRQTACVIRILCARVPVSEGAARSLRFASTRARHYMLANDPRRRRPRSRRSRPQGQRRRNHDRTFARDREAALERNGLPRQQKKTCLRRREIPAPARTFSRCWSLSPTRISTAWPMS